MSHQSLFVFDIETVPDTDAVPNLTGFDDPDLSARRAELERYHLDITDGRNAFPRQPFHKVVAISFLSAELQSESGEEAYLMQELRSGGEEGYGEKQLLQGFFAYLDRYRPRLVSFNGRGFDLPVLKYRAMVHGIPSSALHKLGTKWDSYKSRYSDDWHCDLIEVLSDFGASARVKLNEVCSVMGFPGKFGVDGSKVADMFDAGQVKDIRDYCETDVLNTYLVYLRLQLHRAILSKEAYNRAIADIVTYIETEQATRPHLAAFLEAWGEACHNKFMLD